MKLFICGGGCGEQTAAAYRRLGEVIDGTKPMLYIPLALPESTYDSCYEWASGELGCVEKARLDMVRSAEELTCVDLSVYGALFIGGGNTFRLLGELKGSGASESILAYLEGGGTVFGSSAGAIIFGRSIDLAGFEDENDTDLTDLSGFDMVRGMSVFCHYGNDTDERRAESDRYLETISAGGSIAVLSEEVTLFINGEETEILGNGHCHRLTDGVRCELQ